MFSKKAIDFGIRSYIACLFAFLVLRSDIYFVNYFRGFREVGYYSLAVGFCDGIILIISSIALVLFPKITENKQLSMETTLKVSRLSSLFLITVIIFAFLFSKTVINLFFGSQFINSLLPLYILLPAIYFWSITNLLNQFFASQGYPWVAVFLWLSGLIVNIILNIIYIPIYGMVAAALTSLLAYFVTFVLHYFYLQKFQKVSLLKILIPNKQEIFKQLKILKE
ncbi:MAG: polysaccharide biosynthesis C-terminal domain-containing protein [Caldisericum sp.]